MFLELGSKPKNWIDSTRIRRKPYVWVLVNTYICIQRNSANAT